MDLSKMTKAQLIEALTGVMGDEPKAADKPIVLGVRAAEPNSEPIVAAERVAPVEVSSEEERKTMERRAYVAALNAPLADKVKALPQKVMGRIESALGDAAEDKRTLVAIAAIAGAMPPTSYDVKRKFKCGKLWSTDHYVIALGLGFGDRGGRKVDWDRWNNALSVLAKHKVISIEGYGKRSGIRLDPDGTYAARRTEQRQAAKVSAAQDLSAELAKLDM